MFTCLAIASAIILTPVEKPASRTVQFFDRAIHLSNRVLDRTICPDLVHAYPEKDRSEFPNEEQYRYHLEAVANQRTANRSNAVRHCDSRLLTEGINSTDCKLN